EGQSGQGVPSDDWSRQSAPYRRRILPEGNWNALPVRALPWRCSGDAGPVAGQIELMIDSPAIVLPQVRGGTIKAYAVAAKSRLPTAPDIPTVDEAGLPAFYVSSWSGLWAPKGTPKEVVAKLNSAVATGLAGAAVRSRFADNGMRVFPPEQQTPEALRAHQKAEIEKWWPIIRETGIKAQEPAGDRHPRAGCWIRKSGC